MLIPQKPFAVGKPGEPNVPVSLVSFRPPGGPPYRSPQFHYTWPHLRIFQRADHAHDRDIGVPGRHYLLGVVPDKTTAERALSRFGRRGVFVGGFVFYRPA